MSRRTRLLSLSLAGAAALAWILFALGGGSPPAETSVETQPQRSVRRIPIEPAAVAAVETAAGEEQPPTSEAPVAPTEWPPPRAFTERCRARGGTCPVGCTELAGGRCLDPCFIHTAECSRDCRLPDGTCGFPPPDSE